MVHVLDSGAVNDADSADDDDDDVDSFNIPCKLIGDLRQLNAEIKESKDRRKQLVSVTCCVTEKLNCTQSI